VDEIFIGVGLIHGSTDYNKLDKYNVVERSQIVRVHRKIIRVLFIFLNIFLLLLEINQLITVK